MTLLAADIVERFYTFLWPMLRISAMLLTAPIFSLDALTLPIRIMLALVLTFFIYPMVDWPPSAFLFWFRRDPFQKKKRREGEAFEWLREEKKKKTLRSV